MYGYAVSVLPPLGSSNASPVVGRGAAEKRARPASSAPFRCSAAIPAESWRAGTTSQWPEPGVHRTPGLSETVLITNQRFPIPLPWGNCAPLCHPHAYMVIPVRKTLSGFCTLYKHRVPFLISLPSFLLHQMTFLSPATR
ncbi:hypothetical protein SODALDRAFT_34498 [Sodiomyces alkalinus F11]|uniref:Uncharacterized protein n=1 Tax=Sodiomyces alkalinus (strain CBS 110278 / VKM F-3762 / F11) TaxID=1314773 RepID=A0A3N2Q8Z3_SODAK|nr:hypothetical protein SODALDRAFT_34498 [Sodiomyces alkalinus F11]ROT43243.1 hypothetical protein SODALDRAFT_34498 [Sodiomyces alkalinus F11]